MDDVGLPKSSLQKAIKDALPANMRIAGDASELLVQACNQFVHLISTQVRSGLWRRVQAVVAAVLCMWRIAMAAQRCWSSAKLGNLAPCAPCTLPCPSLA